MEKKPEPKPEPKEPPPPPVDKVEEARKVAAVSGVLAFQDALADMRDSVDVDSLGDTGMSRGESQAAKTERSIIAGAAKGGSGGIQTGNLSRDTGGPALSGREDHQGGEHDRCQRRRPRRHYGVSPSRRSQRRVDPPGHGS